MIQKPLTQYPDAPDIESSTYNYQSRFSGEVGGWLLQAQILATRNAIIQCYPDKSRLQVLDVGGGHGQNIQLLNQLGHSHTIVGTNSSCTEVIKADIANGKVKFIESPLLTLPFKENSFDIVICYRVLSHMTSWESLIAELSRVSSSLVLVDYPTMKSVNTVGGLFFPLKKAVEKNTRPYQCFREHEVNTTFAKNSFNLVYQHKQFFLPMVLHRKIAHLGFSRLFSGVFRKIGLTKRFGSPSISGYKQINK